MLYFVVDIIKLCCIIGLSTTEDTDMTYTAYKIENTKARLCAASMTTNDKEAFEMVKAAWENAGYIVNVETES